MLQTRVIPLLLLKNKGLVKSVKFKDFKYIGDPLNAIRIFNEKEVDELIFLDIDATRNGTDPDFKLIEDFASECFMPVCYGGGITNLEQIKKIFALGIEKISLNISALTNSNLLKEASSIFGNQSIVVTVDVKKNIFGKYFVYNHVTKKNENVELLSYIKIIEDMGAGEIIINSVDLDGTQKGYDLDLLQKISALSNVPIIASGGAGSLNDFKQAKKVAGVSAVAVGSFFVFHGKHKAVLITYPKYEELEKLLK